VHPGDLVLIVSYAEFEEAEARAWRPTVVLVDADNRVERVVSGPADR
jgi:aspartate 1-decarboxylase